MKKTTLPFDCKTIIDKLPAMVRAEIENLPWQKQQQFVQEFCKNWLKFDGLSAIMLIDTFSPPEKLSRLKRDYKCFFNDY
jgi:hypothetical protein